MKIRVASLFQIPTLACVTMCPMVPSSCHRLSSRCAVFGCRAEFRGQPMKLRAQYALRYEGYFTKSCQAINLSELSTVSNPKLVQPGTVSACGYSSRRARRLLICSQGSQILSICPLRSNIRCLQNGENSAMFISCHIFL